MSAKRLQIFAIFSLLAAPAVAEPPGNHKILHDYGAREMLHSVADGITQELGVTPIRVRQWDCLYSNCERRVYWWNTGEQSYRLEGGVAARWLSVGEPLDLADPTPQLTASGRSALQRLLQR